MRSPHSARRRPPRKPCQSSGVKTGRRLVAGSPPPLRRDAMSAAGETKALAAGGAQKGVDGGKDARLAALDPWAALRGCARMGCAARLRPCAAAQPRASARCSLPQQGSLERGCVASATAPHRSERGSGSGRGSGSERGSGSGRGSGSERGSGSGRGSGSRRGGTAGCLRLAYWTQRDGGDTSGGPPIAHPHSRKARAQSPCRDLRRPARRQSSPAAQLVATAHLLPTDAAMRVSQPNRRASGPRRYRWVAAMRTLAGISHEERNSANGIAGAGVVAFGLAEPPHIISYINAVIALINSSVPGNGFCGIVIPNHLPVISREDNNYRLFPELNSGRLAR
eukprot:gene18011-biopygen10285